MKLETSPFIVLSCYDTFVWWLYRLMLLEIAIEGKAGITKFPNVVQIAWMPFQN